MSLCVAVLFLADKRLCSEERFFQSSVLLREKELVDLKGRSVLERTGCARSKAPQLFGFKLHFSLYNKRKSVVEERLQCSPRLCV